MCPRAKVWDETRREDWPSIPQSELYEAHRGRGACCPWHCWRRRRRRQPRKRQVWPLPLNGAGYYPVIGYGAPYDDTVLPAAKAGQARGVTVGLWATLQLAVDLVPRTKLILVDTLLAEGWLVGNEPFYVNLRRDVVLAGKDWLIKNTAMLILQQSVGQ